MPDRPEVRLVEQGPPAPWRPDPPAGAGPDPRRPGRTLPGAAPVVAGLAVGLLVGLGVAELRQSQEQASLERTAGRELQVELEALPDGVEVRGEDGDRVLVVTVRLRSTADVELELTRVTLAGLDSGRPPGRFLGPDEVRAVPLQGALSCPERRADLTADPGPVTVEGVTPAGPRAAVVALPPAVADARRAALVEACGLVALLAGAEVDVRADGDGVALLLRNTSRDPLLVTGARTRVPGRLVTPGDAPLPLEVPGRRDGGPVVVVELRLELEGCAQPAEGSSSGPLAELLLLDPQEGAVASLEVDDGQSDVQDLLAASCG